MTAIAVIMLVLIGALVGYLSGYENCLSLTKKYIHLVEIQSDGGADFLSDYCRESSGISFTDQEWCTLQSLNE